MRKQVASHELFLAERVRAQTVDTAIIQSAVDKAVERIRGIARQVNTAFAWSGGKDSAVIRYLCELAGVEECILGITGLEYPAFLRFVTAHMPRRLEVHKNSMDLDWLALHQDWLFPQTAIAAAKWFHRVQHVAQNVYCKRNKVEALVLGRRLEEGNFVGRGTDHYYKGDVCMLSPIADWSHVLLFAVIDRFHLPLPPFYEWPRGYRCGTHPWAARQWCRSIPDGYREVYQIDPDIVVHAATRLSSAARFLENRNVCAVSSAGSVVPAT